MKNKKHIVRTIILIVAATSLFLGVLCKVFPDVLSAWNRREDEIGTDSSIQGDDADSGDVDSTISTTGNEESEAHTATDDNMSDAPESEEKSEPGIDKDAEDLQTLATLSIEEILFDDNIDARNCIVLTEIPEYQISPYVELNGNKPFFSDAIIEKTKEGQDYFHKEEQYYSQLDTLGRCGVVYEIVSKEIMPTEARGQIGSIQPSGWQTVKYPDLIEDLYLYNRCHLIGYQLGGGNANELNLITGTRYFNVQGMLPFENTVAQYVESSGNHVLYRVTPIFELKNLVAFGVVIEAESLEDLGDGVEFCVYVYNVQPGIVIDYETGDSREMTEEELAASSDLSVESKDRIASDDENKIKADTDGFVPVGDTDDGSVAVTREISNDTDDNSISDTETKEEKSNYYVLNTNTNKFHNPTCDSVNDMKEKNKEISYQSRDEIIARGYAPCKRCNP